MMLHCGIKIQFPFMMREMRFMNVVLLCQAFQEFAWAHWTSMNWPPIMLPLSQ